jgi:RimJ/RimL family protein N-acetyltransferase
VLGLLEGKNVNLRVAEKEDLSLALEWVNNHEYLGEFQFAPQMSRVELEREFESLPPEEKMFFVEKKNGTKIGNIGHRPVGKAQEIGYNILPSERRKDYCSEAVKIMVDYLFLSKDIVRVQAHADTENVASHRVLEKAGFKKEGVVRKRNFIRGEWRDDCLFSILREEWKEPKMLTKTA